MAKSDGIGRSGPAHLTLLVIIGGILLVSPASGASNQETTAEPSMVTFTFEGEFMFLAQMEFEVFDSDQNSVLRSGAGNHQLVLAPGQYNIEARANAGPFSIGMESLEFDSQEYSHVTLTVQYVLVAEVVSVLALVSLALSLLKATRRSFGRLRRKRSISISSNAHVEPTDDMLAEQDPKSDADLVDVLEEHIESFSHGLHTQGAFLPWHRGYLLGWKEYPPCEDQTNLDIPFWPPDDTDSIGEDVWYQFKETESGTMVVELDSEVDYDTRIPLYKLTYEERKSAEEESLPEQEPVDDPYYPGAPGDRELAIKYGLEWIKTPEEEKVLRELWEKENERRKKRGSILISWLVWKEMFKQEQKDLACDPDDIPIRSKEKDKKTFVPKRPGRILYAKDQLKDRVKPVIPTNPPLSIQVEDYPLVDEEGLVVTAYLTEEVDEGVVIPPEERVGFVGIYDIWEEKVDEGVVTPPEGPPVISHHPTSSPTCVDCGHPKDKSHGTGGWEDPFSKEHTRALLEKDRNRVHHDETENCPRVGCGTGCRGIPILNPIDILDWARFDLPNIKASNDAQFTIPDEWEPQDGWEGGKIGGGDLNYYGFGMACAYNCLTWEQTKFLIRFWNRMQGILRGSEELVPPQMLTAAKAGFDEERKRYPERCPEDKSAFDKVVGDLVEDGLLIFDEGKKYIEEEWEELKEKYNSIFGKK